MAKARPKIAAAPRGSHARGSTPTPFDALTKRGQTGRLRALALTALQAWDLPVARLRRLDDGFNTLFRLDTNDGRKFAVRVHLPHYRADGEIAAELAWLAALSRDTSLRVPTPIASRTGAFVVTAHTPGVPQPRRVAVFAWVPGRLLADTLDLGALRRLGVAAATLHAHGRTFDDPAVAGAIVADRLFVEPRVLDAPDVGHSDRGRRARLAAAIARCEAVFASHRRDGGRPRICHGDLHTWNIKVGRDGGVALLDFDDSAVMWPAYDLGIARYYLRVQAGDDGVERCWAALRAGYETRAPWPGDPDDIDAFAIARQLVLLNHLAQQQDRHLRERSIAYFDTVDSRLRAWL